MQVSPDFRSIKVKLKLRFWNANYVGTQFGGAIFSMADPFYMLMLINNLGPDYTVWDKSTHIFFLKPGRTDLFAEFSLSENELSEISQIVQETGRLEWTRCIDIRDTSGELIARVDKVISIKKKKPET